VTVGTSIAFVALLGLVLIALVLAVVIALLIVVLG